MSAKEELRTFIEELTPAQMQIILRRLPQINAELAANGIPTITAETTAESPCVLADERRPA